VEGEVLVADHEELRTELGEVVGKLDRVAIADDREAVEAKSVGDRTEEGVVFREYDS
jgi:hypothetical protein